MAEYAPEYTLKEKLILLAKYLGFIAPIYFLFMHVLLPKFSQYSNIAHCYSYGFVSGLELVSYGLFVVMPLLMALVLFVVDGRRSILVIKLGQNPLPNEKVIKRTKYTYGLCAKIKPVLVLLSVAFLVGFSLRGMFWANDLLADINSKPLPSCENVAPVLE